jgi:hypothetical protein
MITYGKSDVAGNSAAYRAAAPRRAAAALPLPRLSG